MASKGTKSGAKSGARKAGARKSTRKGTSKSATPKVPVPDQLPPATQAEDAAVNIDHAVDRIPVLEKTSNVPYITAADLANQKSATAKSLKDQEKALEEQRKLQEKAAKQAKDDAEAAIKDQQSRAVKVQALRKGFYPHDGRLRQPGEIFDYHLHRDPKTKKLEADLPSWLKDVDGKLETREAGELSASDERVIAESTPPQRAGSSAVL